ncbi:hypothetical protein AXA44_46000 [Rhodococcus sp. SC4]|nr:hypothetical protein AXA44_46000 [Rhodococcus sp. SC4]
MPAITAAIAGACALPVVRFGDAMTASIPAGAGGCGSPSAKTLVTQHRWDESEQLGFVIVYDTTYSAAVVRTLDANLANRSERSRHGHR